jgi:hypothetical protein
MLEVLAKLLLMHLLLLRQLQLRHLLPMLTLLRERNDGHVYQT